MSLHSTRGCYVDHANVHSLAAFPPDGCRVPEPGSNHRLQHQLDFGRNLCYKSSYVNKLSLWNPGLDGRGAEADTSKGISSVVSHGVLNDFHLAQVASKQTYPGVLRLTLLDLALWYQVAVFHCRAWCGVDQ